MLKLLLSIKGVVNVKLNTPTQSTQSTHTYEQIDKVPNPFAFGGGDPGIQRLPPTLHCQGAYFSHRNSERDDFLSWTIIIIILIRVST